MEEKQLTQDKEESIFHEEKLTPEKEKSLEEKNSESNEQCRGEKRPIEDDTGIRELPAELKKMFKPLSCELCSVSVTSSMMAYSHYEGKPHLKNVNNYMKKHYNVESAIKKQKPVVQTFKCEVCNIELTSELVYKMHLTGKQHRKNLKRNEAPPPKINEEVDPTGRFNIGKAFVNEIPLPVPENSDLYCDLCQVFTNTKSQMEVHKKGQKHAKKAARNQLLQNINANALHKSEHYNDADVWEATANEIQNSN
ncbi:zinc finger matrin-type protein 4-like [Rhodnius prolixus]|uniref:C2H2-type domain-containing protein n=1 Tax=Rhodnius prolixus TaxID=13249 RepID=T1IAZ9_RHOPR